jgi:hypothetical protein
VGAPVVAEPVAAAAHGLHKLRSRCSYVKWLMGMGWDRGVGAEPDPARQVAFEGADGVAVGLAFGALAFDVGAGLRVAAGQHIESKWPRSPPDLPSARSGKRNEPCSMSGSRARSTSLTIAAF